MNTLDDVINSVFEQNESAVSCIEKDSSHVLFFDKHGLACAEISLKEVDTKFGPMCMVDYFDFKLKMSEGSLCKKK